MTKTKASFIEPLLHAPAKSGLSEVNQLHQDLTAPSATVFLLMDLESDDASISSKDLPDDLRICLETFETILDGHVQLCNDLRKCGQGLPPFAFSPLNVYNHHVSAFLLLTREVMPDASHRHIYFKNMQHTPATCKGLSSKPTRLPRGNNPTKRMPSSGLKYTPP